MANVNAPISLPIWDDTRRVAEISCLFSRVLFVVHLFRRARSGMHATGSVSPRRARATASGGMWTARRTPTGKFSLGAPSGLWEQLMHNGEAQPQRPMSSTMGSTMNSVDTKKPLCFHKEVYEKTIVDDYREQAVLRSLNMQRVQIAHTQRVGNFRAQNAKARQFEQQIGNPAVWRRKRMEQVEARVASTRHEERPCFTDLDEFETRFAESRSNRPGTAESGVEARLASTLSPRDLLSAHTRRIHALPRQRGAHLEGGHQHMPDVARLMLMTPRGEGSDNTLPGKDMLLASLGALGLGLGLGKGRRRAQCVFAHAVRVHPVLLSTSVHSLPTWCTA